MADPFADLIPKAAAPKPAPASDPFAALVPKPAAAPSPPQADSNPFMALAPQPKVTKGGNPFTDLIPKLGERFADVGRAAAQGQRQANETIKHDFTDPIDPKHPVIGTAKRVGKTALDAVAYPFDSISAVAHNVVGEPVTKLASKVGAGPKTSRFIGDTAEDAAMMANPETVTGKASAAIGKNLAPVGDAVAKPVKAAEKIFSPATVDDHARAAVELHKDVLGRRGIEADRAAHTLGVHQRIVGNASPADQLALIKYVEGRSTKDATIPAALKPAADAVRDVAQSYRKQIEYVLGDSGPSFVKDYYARMWKQKPEEVESVLGQGGKQGSGGNLKRRSIPTYEDGLKAGLTPRYPNPLDAMTAYADNMARFLGTHEILQGMQDIPEIGAKMFTPGKQPEGWVPLKGMKTETPATRIIVDGRVVGTQPSKLMYAPEGAARVYNNSISKGLDHGDIGPVYRGARAVSNGLVQMKLGLSAFHGTVMGQEGMISAMARGVKKLSAGDLSGAKDVVTSPAAFATTYMRGSKMKNQILGKAPVTGLDAKVNALYERTGNRLGMDKIYATRQGTSLLSSAIRGTLKRDLSDAAKRVTSGSIPERAKGAVDLAGNIIQSTAAPLFEHYIPNMKRGAWAQQMGDWLKANPNATAQEQLRYGQRLSDNIDNRFGELVVNNNFWHKSGYQIAQILMLSPSWNIGTAREIGGGIIQIPKSLEQVVKGKGVTDKTAYVGALVGMTMLQNGIATWLHTGQMPEGMDYFAYRTGGTDASTGKPERAMIPSYMKDVLAFTMNDPRQEVANKLNPGLKSAAELYTNKDYKGQPIRDETAGAGEQAKQVGGYLMDAASPMAFGGSAKPKVGSKLSGVERAAGIRPAPRYLTDPEGFKANKEKYAKRDWKAKVRTDAKMKERETP